MFKFSSAHPHIITLAVAVLFWQLSVPLAIILSKDSVAATAVLEEASSNPLIEVRKDIAPDADTGRFNLRIDLATDVRAIGVSDGGTTGETEFTGGTVLIEETAAAGTSLSDYNTRVVCVDDENPDMPFFNESRTGLKSRTATIRPPQGVDDITCTFINTKKASTRLADLIIAKNSIPNDEQDFGFTVSSQATFRDKTFQIDDDSDPALASYELISGLQAGTYFIKEDKVENWRLVDINCGEASFNRINSTIIAVTLVPGAIVKCTFVSQKLATVTVTKYDDYNQNGKQDAIEPALSGWEILLDETAQSTSPLGTTTFSEVLPGLYKLSETLQDGWKLSNISCGNQAILPQVKLAEGKDYLFIATPGSQINCSVGNYRWRPQNTDVITGGVVSTRVATAVFIDQAARAGDFGVSEFKAEARSQVAGASSGGGRVNAEGESTSNKEGNILSLSDKDKSAGGSDNDDWLWWLVAAIAAAAAGTYYYLERTGNNPFRRNEE